ncbi:MAG: hypothetical protein CV082_14080 [Candidatus Brocadia sp. BL1]|nr:MAG: hypothetical protein CV082_14080 [Candidatus Brocadia sp. BL1]
MRRASSNSLQKFAKNLKKQGFVGPLADYIFSYRVARTNSFVRAIKPKPAHRFKHHGQTRLSMPPRSPLKYNENSDTVNLIWTRAK